MKTISAAWRAVVARVREVSQGAFHPVEGGCAGDPSAFEYDLQRRVTERESADAAPDQTQEPSGRH